MLMRKSWATPRYAADKGLLLRDTEPDISGVRPPHLPPAYAGEGADVCVARNKALRSLVKHGGGEPSQ
jgi:hypothetical protein